MKNERKRSKYAGIRSNNMSAQGNMEREDFLIKRLWWHFAVGILLTSINNDLSNYFPSIFFLFLPGSIFWNVTFHVILVERPQILIFVRRRIVRKVDRRWRFIERGTYTTSTRPSRQIVHRSFLLIRTE